MSTIILGLASSAFAFRPVGECGGAPVVIDNNGITMSVNTVTFSTATLRSEVVAALTAWDAAAIPGSGLSVGTTTNALASTRTRDFVNMVAGADINAGEHPILDVQELAITNVRGVKCLSGGVIQEVDILLDSGRAWSSSADYYDFRSPELDEPFDLGQIVMHEMGHGAGFDDNVGYLVDRLAGTADLWPATMHGKHAGGSVIGEDTFLVDRRYAVNEDDRVGVRTFYPDLTGENPGEDLAVQSYVMDPDGALIRDCTTKLSRPSPWWHNNFSERAVEEGLPPEACPSDQSTPPPTEPFDVYKTLGTGATFQLLNLGETSQTVDVELRVTPSLTTPTWTTIATTTATIAPDQPDQVTLVYLVPDTLPDGVYHLVAFVDTDDDVAERDETNNQAVWNQTIEVHTPSGCSTTGSAGVRLGALLAALAGARRRSSR